MEGFQNYFEKMGSNFMVSAFIPSLAFVILTLLVFSPILPPTLSESLIGNTNPLLQGTLIVVVISTIIGFILTSLNVFIYKLFEGYIIFNKLSFLRKNRIKEARRLKKQENAILKRIAVLKKRYLDLFEKTNSSTKPEKVKQIQRRKLQIIESQLESLHDNYEELHYFYDSKFPPDEKYILPTRFGNILRAAETYSETRYQIDGVTMWTRVIKVIDKEYMEYIDTANNQCSFLLYCSLLSAVFSGLSVIVIIYQYFLMQQLLSGKSFWLYFVPLAQNPIVYEDRMFVYFVVSILAIGTAWFFYQASLWNVDQYGDVIRSTYDLYRFKLLEELKLKAPTSHLLEKATWRKVCQFYAVGEANGTIEFEYQVQHQEEESG